MTLTEADNQQDERSRRPILRVERLSKAFPGVQALSEASLEFHAGEIHSIVGENGAGKSTLVKLIAGFERPDSGALKVDTQAHSFKNPRAARKAGITYVPQNAEGVPNFSVGRNVLLGQTKPWINRNRLSNEEQRQVVDALEKMGIDWLTGDERFEELSIAEIRLCQIAAALTDPGRLVILDEPTAVLSDADASTLLHRVDELRRAEKSVIYISHRLNEIMEISDRISILRDGKVIGTYRRGEVDRDTLIDLMARVQTSEKSPDKSSASARHSAAVETTASPILEVSSLTKEPFFNSFHLIARPGEVVGIAGIQGSGHTRVIEAIAGLLPPSSGTVKVDGEAVEAGSVKSALNAGVRLVPADRREQGIVGCRSVLENIVMGEDNGFIRHPQSERRATRTMIDDLDIHTPGIYTAAEKLSGGNQQKVVIARMIRAAPKVLLLSEPTQGIDVRSKAQILTLLRRIAREEKIAIIISSSEFEELIDYSDRIYVMKLGQVTSEHNAENLTYNELLRKATP